MPTKKPSKQKPDELADPGERNIPLLLMAQAIESYGAWLNALGDLGRDQTQVGSQLVSEIAEIQSRHFAKASRITELLVVHAKLSTLWLERQHKRVRSGTTPPKGTRADYDRLVKRQNETIAELRATLGLPPRNDSPK